MANRSAHNPAQEGDATSAIKSWVMIALASIFLLLYIVALLGWLNPLTDDRVVSRLEPIIFVLVGYYFGRLPSQQNEKTLKEEISRQAQKADAAQHAKEQAQQARESLEEKVKNARAVLLSQGAGGKNYPEGHDRFSGSMRDDARTSPVAAALSILNT